MKITCKLNTYYQFGGKGNFILADDDKYWLRDGQDRPDYKLEYRLEIMTVKKKDYTPTILASITIEIDEDSQKIQNISFHKVSYSFHHAQKRIYCNTLERKI